MVIDVDKIVNRVPIGAEFIQVIAEGHGTTSYATGGDTLYAKSLSLTVLDFVEVSIENSGVYRIHPLFAEQGGVALVKLLFLAIAAGAEAANATNLSTKKFRIRAVGRQ